MTVNIQATEVVIQQSCWISSLYRTMVTVVTNDILKTQNSRPISFYIGCADMNVWQLLWPSTKMTGWPSIIVTWEHG
jgi:hypothetical protein